jgi:hypothetical protein
MTDGESLDYGFAASQFSASRRPNLRLQAQKRRQVSDHPVYTSITPLLRSYGCHWTTGPSAAESDSCDRAKAFQ